MACRYTHPQRWRNNMELGVALLILGIYLTVGIMRSSSSVVVVPKCPPHAWSFVDIRTPDGEIQGQHIVCSKCGPLSKHMGDGEV